MKYLKSYKLFEGLRDEMTPKSNDDFRKLLDDNSIDINSDVSVYVYNPHDFKNIIKDYPRLKQLESIYHEGKNRSIVSGPFIDMLYFIKGYYSMTFEEAIRMIKKDSTNNDISVLEAKTKEEKAEEKVIKKRWDKKRGAILKLGEDIKKLRAKVTKDMDSEDEKTKMVATIVRIMDLTGERVGNENSKSEGHHGVSNFYKKHTKIDGDISSFSYTGKSGVKHKISVKDAKVARNLREFMEIPGEIFVTTSGLSVKSPQVNNYLADFDITSKDLRGYRVNKLMSDKLRKLKKPETIGEIKKKFNEVLRAVAEEIGHTPGICRKNYLLPEIEEQWYGGREVQKV